MKLLQDILIVDFSQFLSGPSASLRMADLGARVIKIERPEGGDICRSLYVSDVRIEGESTIFHAINRNKESYVADLKKTADVEKIKELIRKADVVLHNFRPGVMQRIGLDYESVCGFNANIVYGEINGYGLEGVWRDLPGQDLLLQAVSGIMWLNNSAGDAPTPMGVAVADIMAGTHLTQGILAALFKRGVKGVGALVQVNMFESLLDFQFELLTCFYNDGGQLPVRSQTNHANAYIAAPYGVYETKSKHIALAMGSILTLGELIGCEELLTFDQPGQWFAKRDEIKSVLAKWLKNETASHWLEILENAGYWCAPVLDYDDLLKEEGYAVLEMELNVKTRRGQDIRTTRCPLRVNDQMIRSFVGAPDLGEHNEPIDREFGLKDNK